MRKPSRTEAAKPTHTCGLVDEILIVWMVKVERNPLFGNQRVNVGLGAAYGLFFQVHMCTNLLQSTWQMQLSSLLKAFLVTSSFLLLLSRFFLPVTASRPQ